MVSPQDSKAQSSKNKCHKTNNEYIEIFEPNYLKFRPIVAGTVSGTSFKQSSLSTIDTIYFKSKKLR